MESELQIIHAQREMGDTLSTQEVLAAHAQQVTVKSRAVSKVRQLYGRRLGALPPLRAQSVPRKPRLDGLLRGRFLLREGGDSRCRAESTESWSLRRGLL